MQCVHALVFKPPQSEISLFAFRSGLRSESGSAEPSKGASCQASYVTPVPMQLRVGGMRMVQPACACLGLRWTPGLMRCPKWAIYAKTRVWAALYASGWNSYIICCRINGGSNVSISPSLRKIDFCCNLFWNFFFNGVALLSGNHQVRHCRTPQETALGEAIPWLFPYKVLQTQRGRMSSNQSGIGT